MNDKIRELQRLLLRSFNSRLLALTAIPLVLMLWWAAVHFPTFTCEYWLNSIWIDDRFVVLQRKYVPCRSCVFRPYECVYREYLVDCEKNTRRVLRGNVSEPDYSPELPEIAADGRILRLNRNGDSWELHRINPHTLVDDCKSLGSDRPVLIGSRYLLVSAYDDLSREHLLLRDVLSPDLKVIKSPFETHGGVGAIMPVEGATAFFLRVSLRHVEWFDEEAQVTRTRVDWADELKNPTKLVPTPLSSFQSELQMLLLYKITEHGPALVARWPVVGGSGYEELTTSAGWIASLRPDAKLIEVRDAMTGNKVADVPVPPTALPADFRPDWHLDQKLLVLKDAQGGNAQTWDLNKNALVATEGCLDRHVCAKTEEHYLTIKDANYSDPAAWPLTLQIRESAEGTVIAQHKGTGLESARFSSDGTQVKMIDGEERVIFIDTLTGKTLRTIDTTTQWELLLVFAIGLCAVTWLALFYVECNRANVSLPRRALFTTAALLSFTVARLHLSGNNHFYDRLAWQILYAVVIAWGIGIVLNFFDIGKPFHRRALPTAGFLVAYTIGVRVLVEPGWTTHLTIYHFTFGCGLMLIWAYAFRLFSWLFRYRLQNQVKPKRTYALRSLVKGTTVVGLIVGLAIRIDWSVILYELVHGPLLQIAYDSSSRVLVALVAWWCVRRMGPFAPSNSCLDLENSQNSDTRDKWSQATAPNRLIRFMTLALVLVLVILPKAYLQSNGFTALYMFEELWYASFQYVPIAVVVVVGFVAIDLGAVHRSCYGAST